MASQDVEITTSAGLADGTDLHPVQQAFLDHDGYQCGYCTPGQVCSAVGMLDEVRQGWPSAVTADVCAVNAAAELDEPEIRERMSGNLCRCGAVRARAEQRVYLHPIQSTIARDRVASMQIMAAREMPGVLAVLTRENAPRLARTDDAELAILQSDAVAFAASSSVPSSPRALRSPGTRRVW